MPLVRKAVDTGREWFGRLRSACLKALGQGLTPGELAAAVAVGVALGVIPLFGASTPLGLGLGLAFGLNQPVLQAANYLAYPLQLGLLLPFLRLGERLFHAAPLPLSVPALVAGLRSDAVHTMATCWTALWHACVAWVLVAPAGAALLALLLRPVFRRVARQLTRRATVAADPFQSLGNRE
jgi:uncharacterized protein (DUF2062 family)